MIINGEYQGIYALLEKIKRDKNRVDIATLLPTDIEGNELTGGYIIKIDKTTGDDIGGWRSSFPERYGESNRIYFQYHDPKPSEIELEQERYIQSYVRKFESSLWNFRNPDQNDHYSDYADVASFIDYFILTEISKNVDGYRISTYMYKDKDSKGGKLTMGPVWDYNLAFGNADYDDGQYTNGWQVDWPGPLYSAVPFWWDYLRSDPWFVDHLKERWDHLRQYEFSDESIFQIIDSLAVLLADTQERNFERWPILGVNIWPNYFIGQTYDEEIIYLKNWISDRTAWLDENIPNLTNISLDEYRNLTPTEFLLGQNFPNPFNNTTSIKYQIPHASEVDLSIFNVRGQIVAILVSQRQNAGTYKVIWNTAEISSGVYYYQLRTNYKTITKKMILIK